MFGVLCKALYHIKSIQYPIFSHEKRLQLELRHLMFLSLSVGDWPWPVALLHVGPLCVHWPAARWAEKKGSDEVVITSTSPEHPAIRTAVTLALFGAKNVGLKKITATEG